MDIYTCLKNDHDEIKDLLDELIKLDERDSYRTVLVEQIKSGLIPHSRAEESVFYNAIRAVNSDKTNLMHSYKEHMEAETLLRTLQLKDSTDMDWKETAMKLRTALVKHITEEEGKIFSVARGIFSDEEANMMGEAFEKLKARVSQEGFLKTSFDMVVNLMPPRFIEKMRSLQTPDTSAR